MFAERRMLVFTLKNKTITVSPTKEIPVTRQRLITPHVGDVVEYISRDGTLRTGIIYLQGALGVNSLYNICLGAYSIYLDYDGSVSVSGGPFTYAVADDLIPERRIKKIIMWNWGNNIPGLNRGTKFLASRPVFMLSNTDKTNALVNHLLNECLAHG